MLENPMTYDYSLTVPPSCATIVRGRVLVRIVMLSMCGLITITDGRVAHRFFEVESPLRKQSSRCPRGGEYAERQPWLIT